MLWLGANVMLEYDIDEADTLLSSNKTNAIKSLEEVKEQLGNFFNFLIPTLSEGLREIKILK